MSAHEHIRIILDVVAILGGALLLVPTSSARADERSDCAAAYEQTQRLQQKSDLIEAHDEAERCARPSCPALLRDECSRWMTEIESKVPSLVVRVHAGDGCMRSDAKIDVLGGRRGKEADVILVDPGVHNVLVTDPVTGKTKTQTINFGETERRDIDVDFAPPDAVCGKPQAQTPLGKIPKLTLILGSIGGGLVLTGATVGIIGAVKRGDLNQCKPNCSSDRIDAVRPFFIAGDVFAGFGILMLGAAVVTFFASDDSSASTAKSTATSPSPPRVFFTGDGLSGVF